MSDSRDDYQYDASSGLERGDLMLRYSEPTVAPAFWQQKRHVILIGVGIVFFGAIIVDRLVNMYSADAMPDTVQIQRTVDDSVVPEEPAPQFASAEASQLNDSTATPSGTSPDIDSLFGSPLVFVSASEPLYVITEDDRRFDLGSAIDEQTTLAGVTSQRLIVEQGGDLLVVDLPKPSAQ